MVRNGWLSYGRPESGNIREGLVHEGWLKKKRTAFPHTWQRRYFLLLVVQDHKVEGSRKLTIEYYGRLYPLSGYFKGLASGSHASLEQPNRLDLDALDRNFSKRRCSNWSRAVFVPSEWLSSPPKPSTRKSVVYLLSRTS
eukprot:1194726-Prorocentrum_minimum.AAC.1